MAPPRCAGLLALTLLSLAASSCQAKVINVGGDPGWIIQAYTDITAQVGDVLNFTYTPDPKTFHDVWDMKNVDAYTACLFTDAQFLHNQTDFLYTLEEAGTRYFACSAQGFHCLIGQKVTVIVLPGAGGGGALSPQGAKAPAGAKSPPKAKAPTAAKPPTEAQSPDEAQGPEEARSPPKAKPPTASKSPPKKPPGPCKKKKKVINVGGDRGWIIQAYNLTTAHVGDTLNFTYTPENTTYHDVWDMRTLKAYETCNFTNAKFLHNNTDFLYTLKKKGTRYFACSAQGFHCTVGQKVTVKVLERKPCKPTSSSGPAPAPAPGPSDDEGGVTGDSPPGGLSPTQAPVPSSPPPNTASLRSTPWSGPGLAALALSLAAALW